mmetsp:Transcript_39600/g.65338  ORF Transcript_39600/g.65338 Transcript_39600/m.65338 type:complete len:348 (+) Transcript_39600:139-1182(+)
MAKFYLLLICLVVCLASVLGSGQSAYSFRVNHAMASDMDNTEWKSEEIYSVDVEPSLSTKNSGGALKLAPVLLAGTAAKLAMSHPAAKSQRMPRPAKIEVIVETPKPKKVTLFRYVEEAVVDKMAVLVTCLTVLSEGVLSLLLLDALEEASKRISSEGLRNLATLAAWAALVFGAGELLGSLPARLVGRGRAASLAQVRATEARLRRPLWAPSPEAMQALDFLSRASQVWVGYMVWDLVGREYHHQVVENFVWARALEHAWRRVRFNQGRVGFALPVALAAAACTGLTLYEIVDLGGALAPTLLYLPALAMVLVKLFLTVGLWTRNGKESVVPKKQVTRKIKYYEWQ